MKATRKDLDKRSGDKHANVRGQPLRMNTFAFTTAGLLWLCSNQSYALVFELRHIVKNITCSLTIGIHDSHSPYDPGSIPGKGAMSRKVGATSVFNSIVIRDQSLPVFNLNYYYCVHEWPNLTVLLCGGIRITFARLDDMA